MQIGDNKRSVSVDAIDPEVVQLADDIERFVYGGDSEDRAAARLARYGVPDERIRQAASCIR